MNGTYDTDTGPQRQRPLIAYAAFFHVIGVIGTRPLVPLLAIEIGIGPAEIGILVAAFALLPLIFAVRVGYWMDTHRTRPIMILGTVMSVVGLFLPILLSGRIGLYGSQILTGSAFTIFILSAQKSVGGLSDHPWERERNVAIFSMGVATGGLIGPMPAGYLSDLYNLPVAFALLGISMLPGLIFLWFFKQKSYPKHETALRSRLIGARGILQFHPFMGRAFLISSLVLLGKDMFIAYFPLHAQNQGLSATVIGLVIGLHNGGGVLVRLFSLPLVRRLGKNRVVLGSIVVSGALFLSLPMTQDVVILTLVAFCIGLGLGIGQPLSISTTIQLSPPDRIGQVLGLRLSFNRLTQFGTPLLMGGLVPFTGIGGIFGLVGVILLVGTLRLSIPDQMD